MKRGLGIWLALLCVVSLSAQDFANRQLEYLHGLMRCDVPKHSSIFSCNSASALLPLLVEYEAETMTHLGVVLFTHDLKEALGKPICDFQERLFLEVFLQKTDADAQKLLDEYKIKLPVSLDEKSLRNYLEAALAFASKDALEYMLTKDSLTWTATWSNDNQHFSFNFPANYDLILGMDKKEAEERFTEQLQKFQCNKTAIIPVTVEVGNLKKLNDRLYVRQGERLFIQNMNSNIYFFQKGEQEFSLVYDRNFPEESISNIFTHPDRKSDGLQMEVQQRIYGNQMKKYEMNLFDFLCFMEKEHETYIGIEKCTAEEVNLTVIFKSKFYNCYHMLYVQAVPNDFFEKGKSLKTTFYAYIPNQNIKNLYKEYVERNKFKLN